jgi:hypothetical protein
MLFCLNANQTRDLWHNGIISQQKVLPTVLNLFAIKLTVSIVT